MPERVVFVVDDVGPSWVGLDPSDPEENGSEGNICCDFNFINV